MERRQRFIVGVVAAAATFGSLLAFVNPHRFDNIGHNRFAHHGACSMHKNNDCTKVFPAGNSGKETTIDSLNH